MVQITASITESGFTNPILLEGANGVIPGHGGCLPPWRAARTGSEVAEIGLLFENSLLKSCTLPAKVAREMPLELLPHVRVRV